MYPSAPKYVQLIEIIKAKIQQGELIPDEQLPNEDDIAATYNMSRGTVRKAIGELQRLGLLRKEQGRGTFINENKPNLNGFSLVEFDQYIQSQNRVPSTETLTFERIPATKDIARKLDIPIKTEVIHVVQLRLASALPIVYEERYFDAALCPDMTQAHVEQQSIHWLLVEKYQIPLVRLSHTIEMAQLAEDKFNIFKVNKPVAIFEVERLSYTRKDDVTFPAVCYHALYRADEYQFQVQFRTSI